MAPVDLLALCVLSIAVLRGLFLGLIREAFSLAAIGAACVAVRWFAEPAAAWLEARAAAASARSRRPGSRGPASRSRPRPRSRSRGGCCGAGRARWAWA